MRLQVESILCDRVESIEPMLSLKSVAILAKFIYDVGQHLYRSVATEKRARWNFRKILLKLAPSKQLSSYWQAS